MVKHGCCAGVSKPRDSAKLSEVVFHDVGQVSNLPFDRGPSQNKGRLETCPTKRVINGCGLPALYRSGLWGHHGARGYVVRLPQVRRAARCCLRLEQAGGTVVAEGLRKQVGR